MYIIEYANKFGLTNSLCLTYNFKFRLLSTHFRHILHLLKVWRCGAAPKPLMAKHMQNRGSNNT